MEKSNPLSSLPSFLLCGCLLLILVSAPLIFIKIVPTLEQQRVSEIKRSICVEEQAERQQELRIGVFPNDGHTHSLVLTDQQGQQFALGWQCMEPGYPTLYYGWKGEGRGKYDFLSFEDLKRNQELQALFEKTILARSGELLKSRHIQ